MNERQKRLIEVYEHLRKSTYGGGILGRTLPMSVSADDTWLPDEELTW